MLDTVSSLQSSPDAARLARGGASAPRPVFRMETDPEGRIDGSIPVWDSNPSASSRVTGALAEASLDTGASGSIDGTAYVDPGRQAAAAPHAFGFKDLLDMVNPLQHIPLVSNLYRYMTGDQIQPVSQVVGDVAWGGPLAAAASLVNVIVKDATGKDIAGNIVSYAFDGGSATAPATAMAQGDSLSGLPGTVLSFADLQGGAKPAAAVSAFGPSPYDLY